MQKRTVVAIAVIVSVLTGYGLGPNRGPTEGFANEPAPTGAASSPQSDLRPGKEQRSCVVEVDREESTVTFKVTYDVARRIEEPFEGVRFESYGTDRNAVQGVQACIVTLAEKRKNCRIQGELPVRDKAGPFEIELINCEEELVLEGKTCMQRYCEPSDNR